MRYSRPLEIIAMVVVWAAVLIVYDITSNKHFFQQSPAQADIRTTPQLSMRLQHIGCTTGKAAEVLAELQTLPWLAKVELKQLAAEPGMAMGEPARSSEEKQCDVGVLANVHNIEQVDFMELDRLLRARHIVPAVVEFGGIPHFALKARLANLCETCMRDAMDALAPRKDPRGGLTFKWLDSRRVNPKDQSLTAFVRFNNEVHIDEMIRALERAGLPALSLQIVIE